MDPVTEIDVGERGPARPNRERTLHQQRRVEHVLPEQVQGKAETIAHTDVRAHDIEQLVGQFACQTRPDIVGQHAAAVPLPRDVRAG